MEKKNQKISNEVNVEINNRTKNKIDLVLVKKVAEKFLESKNKKKFNVSIAFVSDNEIKNLNKRYRKINKVTDILSFAGEENFLGEIVISYAQIRRQAKKFNNKPKDELVFILVHGLLHLLGYDDRTETGRKKMEKLGDKFIKSVKL
ncbi:MAG: rRNA maturation RNase YbeY [Patescibacteria group bacterium]